MKNVLLLVIAGLLILLTAAQMKVDHQRAEVQRICDKAHNETNGQSEQACGAMQDKYNLEYLCSSTGNHCWVETK